MTMTIRHHRSRFISRLVLANAFVCLLGFPLAAQAQSAFDDPGTATAATGGDLVSVNEAIDAGAVALGSSSQVVTLFRNDDTKPINIGEISLYPSSNISATISENRCSDEALAPQEVCAIAFSIKGLQSGRFRMEMLLRHDGRARLLTTSINGSVDVTDNDSNKRNNDIEILPEEIDFETLNASRPQVKSVMLRNITSQPITVSDISIESSEQAGYVVRGDCGKLNSGGACVISVTWTPQQIGPATGAVVVKHDGPSGMANIPLEGIYKPDSSVEAPTFSDAVPGKGLLVSSLSEIDFGSGIEKVSSITVSLVNAGDAPLTLNSMRLTNKENGLTIDPTGCRPGRVLNPIEACPMTISWTPAREGNVLDDVTIMHSGARGVLVLPLRGAASKAVSKDSQAINLSDFRSVPRLSVDDIEGSLDSSGSGASASSSGGRASSSSSPTDMSLYRVDNVRGILDGYTITSLSKNRAIINGAGGSRVVMDGENTVIGGVPWVISVKPGAVQFIHEDQSIILLFDRSLSFINSTGSQSSSGTGTGTGTSTSSTRSTSSASPATP